MKSFFERLKDFIYETMDYLLIIAIIIGVVSLIGWRLDILFDSDKDAPTPPLVADETDPDDIEDVANNDDTDIDPDQGDDDPSGDQPGSESPDTEAPNTPDNNPQDDTPDTDGPEDDDEPDSPGNDSPDDNVATTRVVIPDGTLPSTIGTILETNGLIESKNEFVIRAQAMNLDRKLKSGTFTIKNNASLDEIIKIIAKEI